MKDVFIARQPILTEKEKIFGYELLFRNGNTSGAVINDDYQATATVMMNALNSFGFNSLVGGRKGFINVNAGILLSGFIDLLPHENTVLEILETQVPDKKFIELCRTFKEKGYSLALDDFTYNDSFEPLLNIVDYVKLDVMIQERKKLTETIQIVQKYPVKILAEKVETKDDFRFCQEVGCELFQGYFFAKPTVMTTKSLSASQIILLELINGLAREEEMDSLEKLFKKSPQLDIKLLTFINSAGFYLMQKVTSIRQAMMLLGYKNLQKWVALLLFAQDTEDFRSNPLLERAAIRGLMMEFIVRKITGSRSMGDTAFIVGILSLTHVLLGITMNELVSKLNLTQDIKDALTKREGPLGSALLVTEKAEVNGLDEVQEVLKRYSLEASDVLTAETNSLIEYESIGNETKS
jgi:EAL and modified HD-GYP domain-containing signal transduction protein